MVDRLRVPIGAEIRFVVLNDDELPVTQQAGPGVNDAACACSADLLAQSTR